MNSATSAEPSEITDQVAIKQTLMALQASGELASLSRDSDGLRISARLVGVDEKPAGLIWEIKTLAKSLPVALGDALEVQAMLRAGHLAASGLLCRTIGPPSAEGTIRLSTGWPSVIALQQARREWRARLLPKKMPVAARLAVAGGSTISGWLCDLSVGGCRIGIERGYRAPQRGSMANLCLRFENGETVKLDGRVSNVAKDGAACGLAFVGTSDEMSRHLWWLACEIDREFERNRQSRDELRALAPSVLFRPAGTRIR